MSEFLRICAVVCPLLFLAGFVDSVAGGGGLISFPAYIFVGIPIHVVSGTSKVISSLGTSAATVNFIRSGKADLRVALWAALGAVCGSPLGSRLALWCSEALLQGCILAALPVVAVVMTVKRDLGMEPRKDVRWTPRQQTLLSVLIGFVMGLYDGLIGPGSGTFMIMAFTALLGIDLLTASGCAKITNLASNVSSAVVWIFSGKILWSLVLPSAACCMLATGAAPGSPSGAAAKKSGA